MNNDQHATVTTNATRSKPYSIVGSCCLTSHVWKHGDAQSGFFYRFNLVRTRRNGEVTQLLRPEDVLPLAKFVQVISQVFLDDGCISQNHRNVMLYLAHALDELLDADELKEIDSDVCRDSHNRRRPDGNSASV